MRTRAFLLALTLLALGGCLEDPAVKDQLYELTAENRAWQDNASALDNASRLAAAQRDDLSGILNVSEERLAEADAALAAARAELEGASANATRLGALLAEAEKVTSENKTVNDLLREAEGARAELARVQALYDASLAQEFNALTRVSRGNVSWQFTDLRGDTHVWRYPIEDYREEVKRSRPMDQLYFNTSSGKLLRVPDPRPYAETELFEGVIADLTNGRSERDFVREAFHLKRQLIVYEFQLIDEKGFYKYPGETLVEGTGVCGDTTILLQSLLAAGKQQAGYTYETALWGVDWNLALGRLIEDPETVNHALIEVKFADGEVWYVETTSYDFLTHPQAYGWRFEWT